ncbi:MAG: glutamyl-tRNA reductase [Actinobacteria bacterium]|nr:glutamyl-tRNA reductase [Actinomycetota bacterium]
MLGFLQQKIQILSADIHIIAFTHRILSVAQIGSMQKSLETLEKGLMNVKSALDWTECMALATCNRVEITFISARPIQTETVEQLLFHLCSHLPDAERRTLAIGAQTYSGLQAVRHFFEVASSLDSLVIGEREIITQVRESFERCRIAGLTGDSLRLLLRFTIETAKRVFTETEIANRPVSVVSLAFHELVKCSIPTDSRVLMIGAGVTNTTMGRFLKKHGFTQFTVFNRTLEKAQQLAEELGGQAFPLKELDTYQGGFDVLISCTGAEHLIVASSLYEQLLQGDTNPKTLIDLAIPQDLDPTILAHFPNHYISVAQLQAISDQNLQVRGEELSRVLAIIEEALREFEQLFLIRQAELAMRSVPEEIKRIKLDALQEVFKEEIDALDPHSREVLEKVLGYVEKKYIAGPMKLAKEILVKHG